MNGRALTRQQKEEAAERLLRAWNRVPMLRLGQFIDCAGYGLDLFSVEDSELIARLEALASEAFDAGDRRYFAGPWEQRVSLDYSPARDSRDESSRRHAVSDRLPWGCTLTDHTETMLPHVYDPTKGFSECER